MYKYKYSTQKSFLFPNPSPFGLKEGIAFVAVELFSL